MELIRPDMNLSLPARAIADLTYAELVRMVEAILDTGTDGDVRSYYMAVIDATLPGAAVCDLIYHRHSWFRDDSYFDVGMSPTQMAAWLMAWTEKRLPGAEGVALPTIPESKRRGPPRVIFL